VTDDLVLPWWTNILSIAAIFVAALGAFHLLFLKWCRLTKRQWKWADYWWLSLALLGILSTVSSVRQDFAKNLDDTVQARFNADVQSVESALASGREPAICRSFSKPEHTQLERDFEEECKWFSAASQQLPNTPFAKRQALRIQDLGTPSSIVAHTSEYKYLEQSIDIYDVAVAKREEISRAENGFGLAFALRAFGPMWLVIALALRITKVTWEISLEKSDTY
jgi:hypothetical protein